MTEEKADDVQKTNETSEELDPKKAEEILYKDNDSKEEDKKEDDDKESDDEKKEDDKKDEDKEEDKEEDKKDDKKDDGDDKKEDDDSKDDDKKNDDKKEDDKKEETYELKQPENTFLTQDRLDEIAGIAKEQGLSKETAQMMVDRENDAVAQYKAYADDLLNNLADVEWPKQAKEDKEIGGENFSRKVELSKRAFKEFGSEEFQKILNETGYGNHPEVIRTFSRIGERMANDTLIFGETGKTNKKTAVEVLYGSK